MDDGATKDEQERRRTAELLSKETSLPVTECRRGIDIGVSAAATALSSMLRHLEIEQDDQIRMIAAAIAFHNLEELCKERSPVAMCGVKLIGPLNGKGLATNVES